MYSRILNKLKEYSSKLYRKKINENMKKKLVNKDPTIISSNCIGGILSHDLGLQFRSPTVNLFMTAEDYINFIENLAFYISMPFTDFDVTTKPFPIGKLGDISVYFVHYKTVDECVEKWNARKDRIDFDNIFVTMTDRNCESNLDVIIDRFQKLPYNKVFFSHKPYPNHDCVVYIPGFEKDGKVGELNKFVDFYGNRYYEKYFDCVNWLNGGKI